MFKFVVGARKKEYNVHGAVLSKVSKPLNVLLTGPHKEAKEHRVNWPEVDEKTFVRFVQWAYTGTYITEEPDIILDESSINMSFTSSGTTKKTIPPTSKIAEKSLYSLSSVTPAVAEPKDTNHCHNSNCSYYMTNTTKQSTSLTCLVCRQSYQTDNCYSCGSVYSKCPRCYAKTAKRVTGCCSNTQCSYYKQAVGQTRATNSTCLTCQRSFNTSMCSRCRSIFSDCPHCSSATVNRGKRGTLIDEFLSDTIYPTTTSVFVPRKNTEGCEDYSGVFLCHAKLYVLGDTYDIPTLRQLSLHRLHATLKDFTLYPSRLNDIAALAKFVFENTTPGDKIRDMITLYYACIIEDASKHDGLKSLVDDIPDFAFGLISKMSQRLE